MKTIELHGYTARIEVHHDEDCGPPWKEHDGHGEVSEWTSRDKAPGELLLCSDRGSKRYYDFAGAMKTARKDGWGIGPETAAEMERKLGRKPTKGEILHAAVMADFDYLRGWANDEWHWNGYTTKIEHPDGSFTDGDSCWGFGDEKYMLECAEENAIADMERMAATDVQTQLAECCP